MRWTERTFRDEVARVQRELAKAGGERWPNAEADSQRNRGRLLLRVQKGAAHWYFRYSPAENARDALPIGRYGDGGLSLGAARDRADRFRVLLRDQATRDIRAYRRELAEQKRAQREAARRERERASTAADAAERYTLKTLCAAYVADLTRRGKATAAREAEGIFRRHVSATAGAMPARDVTGRDVRALLLKLTEAGKDRAAGKLRSYLRAAYQAAIAGTSSALEEFKLDANPAAATAAVGAAGARDRVLTAAELRALLGKLGDTPAHDAIRLGVLLGGQRPAQLLRATVTDADLAARTLMLRDPKGKRKAPRLHLLPLRGEALKLAQRLTKRAATLDTSYLFTTAGDAPLRPETVSAAVADLVRELLREKTIREAFMLSDLRRTCETMLAALGIHRDVRAQLLSHGLGGVQQAHYDRHTYAAEKEAALLAWEARLRDVRAAADVVPIRGKRRKA